MSIQLQKELKATADEKWNKEMISREWVKER